ncbi:N-acetylated-alpha-linked acidic dipeptidase 2 [Plakobranchus ocellatus]|uniref:N-acetylated-alpha-linked acidic dipeptidase 2 n=1 Tax=Plakobranchus ocellatus TaxID=259542 RepID=A0AAV4ABH3_9GAST|nr:N-acetylated-alpha-linked acidic dipeptidase 2 [Plakobranchus ocellatus]
MATEFWDSRGMILLDILPKGESVNADRYCETLDRLRHAVRRKRPGLLRREVVLQHNNATPTRQNAQRNGLNVTDIAQANGALGVIMYTDPAEFTGMRSGDTRVYPDTWWLPPDGVQRGTVFTGEGDPLTPGYPANDLAYRYKESDVSLPRIPSHAIGYGAAEKIMRHLGGMEVPSDSDWQGGMNVTYRTGPGFLDTAWYVLLGNHRDAWIYGALDPSTGTAAMLEIARVMGNLAKTGMVLINNRAGVKRKFESRIQVKIRMALKVT